MLANSISFNPADVRGSLSNLPESPGVFALCPAEPSAEPYLSKTPNLRRRLLRFLRAPSHAPTGEIIRGKRLQLAHLVHHIEYSATGSEFESSLLLYAASFQAFGERARRRLRLRPPVFLRMSLENPYPRVYVTSRISQRAAAALFGPFPSRAAGERYGEEMLNLFLLRRCHQDLNPDPAFPGCVYSEMKMCLAPCYQGCSDDRYRLESDEVLQFLSTGGSSLLKKLERERDESSNAMEFERARAIHQRMQRVQGVAHLAGDAVHSLAQLSGILVQPSAAPSEVALFALKGGFLNGPSVFSTAGMRHPNEQSGSSSLFAHPVVLQPIVLAHRDAPLPEPTPLDPKSLETSPAAPSPEPPPRDPLETRLKEALGHLEEPARGSSQMLADHLALFARWFYRPATRRVGEVLWAGQDGQVPHKALLRAISRVAAAALPEAD